MATRFNAITNPSLQTFTENLTDIRTLGSSGLWGLMDTDMRKVAAREAQLKNYLGSTDYDTQLEESKNLAKLQIALAAMKHGFAAAGATPVRGESAASTLSRELLSPVAGDITPIASNLLKQRREVAAAKRQEERQLRLAALQDVKDQDKARRDLALALTPKPTATTGKLGLDPFVVVSRDDENKLSLVKRKGGNAAIQVRQGSMNGVPTLLDIKEKKPFELGPNQEIMKLSEFTKGADNTGETLAAAQYHLRDSFGNIYTITDDDGETRTPMYKSGSKRGTLVEIGTEIVFEKEDLIRQGLSPVKVFSPSKETAPTGLKDPKFMATLAGYLGQLGGQQDRLGSGKYGIKFVPRNYKPEKGLDPNQADYPFARVDGMALTLADKKKFSNQLETSYFNALKTLKPGDSALNVNREFTKTFFNQVPSQFGFAAAPVGKSPNPLLAKTEAAVTEFYKRTPNRLQQEDDLGSVMDGNPLPVGTRNFNSAFGKLKLFREANVPMGPETNSPAPTIPGEDVTVRATKVKNMDRRSILFRRLAEIISKDTSLAGKLSMSATPDLDAQLQVVGKAVSDKAEALTRQQNDPASIQAAQLFSASLDAVARLDRMSVAAQLSGVQGVVRGPAIGAGIRYLGTDFLAWFKNSQEQEATRDFVAGLPVLKELFGRELVKATEGKGSRVTNQDLLGVQKTLATLNENEDFSAAKVRELRRYLVSTIRNTATQLGNFVVPDSVLEEAARLGVDLKAVQGKGGYYNPYLNNGKYVVSNRQIPELSKEYMDSLRTEGLFNYLSDRKADPRYRMIKAKPDSQGTFQPVYTKVRGKETNNLVYINLSKEDLTNPDFKGIVDFNKNWLRKTYRLGN